VGKYITDLDLFGEPVIPERIYKTTRPKGYAGTPGRGPDGERCNTCEHSCYFERGRKRWWKCELIEKNWTHGRGSDVLAKSPACEFWEQVKVA